MTARRGRFRRRRADDRGAPGLLDRHMSRYRPTLEAVFRRVGARRTCWSRGLPAGRARIGASVASLWLDGWRTRVQRSRSRAPPQRIRRKAQPDIEGIETDRIVRTRHGVTHVSQSPARHRGHRNIGTSSEQVRRMSASQSPARHRGHRNPRAHTGAYRGQWSQSPARHRGHRNMQLAGTRCRLAAGRKAQPDIEGIETRTQC